MQGKGSLVSFSLKTHCRNVEIGCNCDSKFDLFHDKCYAYTIVVLFYTTDVGHKWETSLVLVAPASISTGYEIWDM